MNRLQEFTAAVNQVTMNSIRANMPDVKPVLIAIDSEGDEYFFESHVDDKIMWIYRPGRTPNEKYFVRARVWTKYFKFKRVDSDYVLKPLKPF